MSQPITIIKRNHNGQEVLRYQGILQAQTPTSARVLAYFSGNTRDLGYMTLKKGDEFTEWFYTDRWYNVFRICDGEDGTFKGWYCNFTRPAIITPTSIASDDLALDFFVYPDRRILVLDEDEYNALTLTPHEHQAITTARAQLQTLIQKAQAPFDTT